MSSALILSSDSHVFEPPDLWQTRIDRGVPRSCAADASGSTAPTRSWSRRIRSSPGSASSRTPARGSRPPRPSPPRGASRTCTAAGTTPSSTSRTWRSTGWPAKSSIPRRGSSTSRWRTRALMSAIFRAYNDWLAEFCRTDPARLKGIAMINLDDVQDGIRELERAARLGLAGAMITEYPLEDRRYDQPEYEPFWAAAAGARHAAEPAHGHAAAGQDPRGRRRGRCATPAAARRRRSIRRCRCAT